VTRARPATPGLPGRQGSRAGQLRPARGPGHGRAGTPRRRWAPRARHGHGHGNGGNGNGGASAAADAAALALAERTADLQRLQAEYANYRKRVERDRVAVREQALASVLGELLPVLDDIGRAREHGELTGGFKSVAESLEAAVAKLGLISYGEDGDPFDPNLHEALMLLVLAGDRAHLRARTAAGLQDRRPDTAARAVAVAEPGGDDGTARTAGRGGPEPADTN
jgi:molecular chaperone GrpE